MKILVLLFIGLLSSAIAAPGRRGKPGRNFRKLSNFDERRGERKCGYEVRIYFICFSIFGYDYLIFKTHISC